MSAVVGAGLILAWWLYSRRPMGERDALEQLEPDIFSVLNARFYIDELYQVTIIRLNALLALGADFLDRFVWSGIVGAVGLLVVGLAWMNRATDEFLVNLGFDRGCGSVRGSGKLLSRVQGGQIQTYLKILGAGMILLVLLLVWGWRS